VIVEEFRKTDPDVPEDTIRALVCRSGRIVVEDFSGMKMTLTLQSGEEVFIEADPETGGSILTLHDGRQLHPVKDPETGRMVEEK